MANLDSIMAMLIAYFPPLQSNAANAITTLAEQCHSMLMPLPGYQVLSVIKQEG